MEEMKEAPTYEAEILWESEGKNSLGAPFLSVKRARGYYVYAERAGKDSIAFILWNQATQKIGLIFESKPPLDETFDTKMMKTTAFGGSLDMPEKSLAEICQLEVMEEAGYFVDLKKIFTVGTTLVSSQMSQGVVGFFVDVTGLTPGKTETEFFNEAQEEKDPDEFKHNKVVWMTVEELFDNNDWKSIWIFSKMYYTSNVLSEDKAY